MAKRGTYKKGYYIVLLYALDLFYRLESQKRPDPNYWQPLPRKRVDQFLKLIMDSLSELGADLPELYSDFLKLLEQAQLGYLAKGLNFVVKRKLSQSKGKSLEQLRLEEVVKKLTEAYTFAETHPQVRKLSQFLRDHLDPLWKETIMTLAQEEASAQWDRASIILGSLPPHFTHNYKQIMWAQAEGEDKENYLSAVQFYGLATGSLPQLSKRLQPVMEAIVALPAGADSLIKNLSNQQVAQLKSLDQAAIKLVILLRSLRKATPQWRTLVTEMSQASRALPTESLSVIEAWQRRYGVNIKQLGEVAQLVHHDAWTVVEALDEELIRMIDRRELTLALVKTTQTWDEAFWANIRTVLKNEWLWLNAFRDAQLQFSTLASQRTPAQLRLRDLFPQTVAWLDEQFREHYQELLLRDLDEVAQEANRYALRVEKKLFKGRSYPTTPILIKKHAQPVQQLIRAFKSWPDKRKARGRIYPQWLILSLTTLAELCGYESFLGTARFAAQHPEILKHLGFSPRRQGLPSHDTFRYALAHCDASQRRAMVTVWARDVLMQLGVQADDYSQDRSTNHLSYLALLRNHYRDLITQTLENFQKTDGELASFHLETDLLGAIVAADFLREELNLVTVISQNIYGYHVLTTDQK